MSESDHRTCPGCGRDLPLAEFSTKVAATGRRSTNCRSCVAGYWQDYYAKRQGELVALAHHRKLAQKEILRTVRAEFLHGYPCQECGEAPAARINPPFELTKGKPVSDAIRNGWSTERFVGLLVAAEEIGGLLCAPCSGRRGAVSALVG